MARKIVFFLMVGVFLGALMSAEPVFAAVGGVADYWPEDGVTNLAQERGPVETGALPEMSQHDSNDVPTMEIGGLIYRVGIDTP